MGSHQVLACHNFVNQTIVIALKTQIPVSNDANQVIFLIYNWNSTDMVFAHQFDCICHCATSSNCDWIIYHTILGTFHNGYLACLFFDAHILVYNADTTLACDCNGHGRFCDCVHGGCDERNLELNIP